MALYTHLIEHPSQHSQHSLFALSLCLLLPHCRLAPFVRSGAFNAFWCFLRFLELSMRFVASGALLVCPLLFCAASVHLLCPLLSPSLTSPSLPYSLLFSKKTKYFRRSSTFISFDIFMFYFQKYYFSIYLFICPTNTCTPFIFSGIVPR